ncbi:hypothetical protein [Bacillus sp. 2205SS5-2]|uniref:hypothetical protein n=1 Tax=Bacillus sp. 2205SS5-2 TaxID=3109031 RepID=UPI003006018B
MTRIPEKDRNIFEQAIYLPMVLTVLNQDLTLIQNSSFKLKNPYLEWIEQTMMVIQKDLSAVKKTMRSKEMKVERMESDEAFTMYLFLYKGFEEHHNYFNPRLRNGVESLMRYYLYSRFQPNNPSTSHKKA